MLTERGKDTYRLLKLWLDQQSEWDWYIAFSIKLMICKVIMAVFNDTFDICIRQVFKHL